MPLLYEFILKHRRVHSAFARPAEATLSRAPVEEGIPFPKSELLGYFASGSLKPLADSPPFLVDVTRAGGLLHVRLELNDPLLLGIDALQKVCT